jgi:hypothetical protein
MERVGDLGAAVAVPSHGYPPAEGYFKRRSKLEGVKVHMFLRGFSRYESQETHSELPDFLTLDS